MTLCEQKKFQFFRKYRKGISFLGDNTILMELR